MSTQEFNIKKFLNENKDSVLAEGTGLSAAQEVAQDMIDGGMAATSDQNFNDLYDVFMERYREGWGWPDQFREEVRAAYKAILKKKAMSGSDFNSIDETAPEGVDPKFWDDENDMGNDEYDDDIDEGVLSYIPGSGEHSDKKELARRKAAGVSKTPIGGWPKKKGMMSKAADKILPYVPGSGDYNDRKAMQKEDEDVNDPLNEVFYGEDTAGYRLFGVDDLVYDRIQSWGEQRNGQTTYNPEEQTATIIFAGGVDDEIDSAMDRFKSNWKLQTMTIQNDQVDDDGELLPAGHETYGDEEYGLDEDTSEATPEGAYEAGYNDGMANNGEDMSWLNTSWGKFGNEYKAGYRAAADELKTTTEQTLMDGQAEFEKGASVTINKDVAKYGGSKGKILSKWGDNYLVKIKGRRSPEIEFSPWELSAEINEVGPFPGYWAGKDGPDGRGKMVGEHNGDDIDTAEFAGREPDCHRCGNTGIAMDNGKPCPDCEEGDFQSVQKSARGGIGEEIVPRAELDDTDPANWDGYNHGDNETGQVFRDDDIVKNADGKWEEKPGIPWAGNDRTDDFDDDPTDFEFDSGPEIEKLSWAAISDFGDVAGGGGDPIDYIMQLHGLNMESIDAEAQNQGYEDAYEWAESYTTLPGGVNSGEEMDEGMSDEDDGDYAYDNFKDKQREKDQAAGFKSHKDARAAEKSDDIDGLMKDMTRNRFGSDAVDEDEYSDDDAEAFAGKGEVDTGDSGVDSVVKPGDMVSIADNLGGEAKVIAQRAGYIVIALPRGGMKVLKDDEWWIDDSAEMTSGEYADVDYEEEDPEELAFESAGATNFNKMTTAKLEAWIKKNDSDEPGMGAVFGAQLKRAREVLRKKKKVTESLQTKIREAKKKAGSSNPGLPKGGNAEKRQQAIDKENAKKKVKESDRSSYDHEDGPARRKAAFKRQEMQSELGHEDEWNRQQAAKSRINPRTGHHIMPATHDDDEINEIVTPSDELAMQDAEQDRAPGEARAPVNSMAQAAADSQVNYNQQLDAVENNDEMQDAIRAVINPEDGVEEPGMNQFQDDEFARLQELLGMFK